MEFTFILFLIIVIVLIAYAYRKDQLLSIIEKRFDYIYEENIRLKKALKKFKTKK